MKNQLLKLLPSALQIRLRRFYYTRRRTVSQAGQDFWIFGEAFNEKKNGFFVEIGSADGVYLNNTLLLETRYDWQGICIEASPTAFNSLKLVRSARCLNMCIDSKEGEVEFAPAGLFGGIVDNDTDNPVSAGKGIKLKTKTLVSVLKNENAPKIIDYLSLDAEGAEDRILGEFPFEEFRFNCMTIERPKALLREVLKRNCYVLVKEIPRLDVFYIHESFVDSYLENLRNFWERRSTW
jgi:FkbM family methyltransferase